MPKTLDDLVTRMYAAISFQRGAHPDWEDDRKLFAPGARLARITDQTVEHFDLPSFEVSIEKMIASGELPEFREGEIARKTFVFGDMAHLWSVYESRRENNVIGRGINSIQAIRRDGEWKIHSMVWFRESQQHPIPEEFLIAH